MLEPPFEEMVQRQPRHLHVVDDWQGFEKFHLRSLLHPYLNEPIYDPPNARVVPPDSLFRCPSDDPSDDDPQPNRSESYTGLVFHFNEHVRMSVDQGMVWTPDFFSRPSAVPVQWGSSRNQHGYGQNGISWHPSGNRPTAFIDGHARILSKPEYTDDSGWIKASNAPVHSLHNTGDRAVRTTRAGVRPVRRRRTGTVHGGVGAVQIHLFAAGPVRVAV